MTATSKSSDLPPPNEEKYRPPFNPLEGCCWPDPDPSPPTEEEGASTRGGTSTTNELHLNDVSRMSSTPVEGIFFPRTEHDVLGILERARNSRKQVSIRGTQHSMGGHSLVQNGFVIDSKYLNCIRYDSSTQLVTVQAGCSWADVIQCLNQYQKSPKVLQSYCTFSVGGTLSVNAHGISSDETLASCVRAFRLARYDERGQVQMITCTRPNDHTAELRLEEELFGLALGGYGLFGVITECTLEVVDNCNLTLDSLSKLSVVAEGGKGMSEFERIWEACRKDSSVEIKLARLNILSLESASLYIFRRGDNENSSQTTSSNLPLQPKKLSLVGRLLYKWALPVLKEYRQYTEDVTGQALDMPPHSFETTRNDVLWESAVPLSKIYSPLVLVEDTFVLQEFFVPCGAFQDWIRQARPIYQEIDAYQRLGTEAVKPQSLILLNTTIRFVEQDKHTFLSYARSVHGCYAFVLYYRIKLLDQVERDLGRFHNRFADVAVGLGGTFYLPYRKCYNDELLQKAYPMLKEFGEKKDKTIGVFSNEWFNRYVRPHCSESNAFSVLPTATGTNVRVSQPGVMSREEFMAWLPRQDSPTLERRTNSYRALLRDKTLRKRFEEEFLVNVFNLVDPSETMRVMSKAAWDPQNQTDLHIFEVLHGHFHGQSPSSPLAALEQGWRGVRQLSHQKAELTHETAAILHRLGLFGRIRSYLSVGDHGKMVRSFHEAGMFDKSSGSCVYVAHDFGPTPDDLSLNAVLERGSLDPIGDCTIQFDYTGDDPKKAFANIPSGTMDLVTLNQGLHHFQMTALYGFLVEMRRVLSDQGVFIFREHDLRLDNDGGTSTTSAPVAMLDLAHSVFNAITGVPVHEEAGEVRAFRPLQEWRCLMQNCGFRDTLQFGLEKGDSTFDFMLCFGKCDQGGQSQSTVIRESIALGPMMGFKPIEPPVMETVRTLLAQVPGTITHGAEFVVSELLVGKLPYLKDWIQSLLLTDIPKALIEEEARQTTSSRLKLDSEQLSPLFERLGAVISNKLEKLIEIASGVEHLLEDISIRETSNMGQLLSMPELWLLAPFLERKAKTSPASIGDIERMVLCFIKAHLPILLETRQSKATLDSRMAKSDQGEAREESRKRHSRGASDADVSVDSDEVLAVMMTLGDEIPGLLDPAIVLANSGFTLSQQSALVAALAAPDLPGLADQIAYYHDHATWRELRKILVGDERSVAQSKDLPTKGRLLSKSLDHPWYHALKAFLKGPRVHLKQQALFGMQFLNLKELINLYQVAKEEANTAQQSQITGISSYLEPKDIEELHAHTKNLYTGAQTKSVKIRFFNNVSAVDLYDVAEVVKAEFGYKSLTSNLSDITSEVRALHADIHMQLEACRSQHYLSNSASWQDIPSVGFLPLHESMLNTFRNKKTSLKIGDSLRRSIVSAGTLGLKGENVLKLQYIPLRSLVVDSKVDTLCDFARKTSLIDADLHQDDGHFTWFKLSEWMQVEILDLLTKSLAHTPWYHFPFMEFISLYFRVLFQETKIVAKEHGLVEAYSSMAFLTNFVPGVVMSFIFLQLQLLGYPLKLSLPTYQPELMVEELLMTASLPSLSSTESSLQFLRETIDPRIRNLTLVCSVPGHNTSSSFALYRMEVPTFKSMGEILIKIGECLPSARLLQISNQKVVQTRLVVEFGESIKTETNEAFVQRLVSRINSLEGLQVVFQYCYPMDNQSLREAGELEARTVHLAVKVFVPYLLDLVRVVADDEQVKVSQVYDFWSG
eukprot:CAMPEP_0113531096 /NCGR_PEP_ID=MMETSP0015_2-20120614/3308_1 /TAXON_ID=2838 /ORGANISM="Odontella" /LENGTH=1747 /DNA_ID=CAMNT_0000429897 /DNA_START=442 /DNA_END=5685 /DNA_ORIENTATION=- /assembly_acc=CAM_ASM_000160